MVFARPFNRQASKRSRQTLAAFLAEIQGQRWTGLGGYPYEGRQAQPRDCQFDTLWLDAEGLLCTSPAPPPSHGVPGAGAPGVFSPIFDGKNRVARRRNHPNHRPARRRNSLSNLCLGGLISFSWHLRQRSSPSRRGLLLIAKADGKRSGASAPETPKVRGGAGLGRPQTVRSSPKRIGQVLFQLRLPPLAQPHHNLVSSCTF